MFFHGNLDIISCGHGHDGNLRSSFIQGQPSRQGPSLVDLHLLVDLLGRFFSGLYGDFITTFDQEAGDIDLASVDVNMAMIYQLPCGPARDGKPAFEDDVVEASFQKTEQGGAGVSFLFGGLGEVSAELAFEDAVITFYFLLFSETYSV